MMIKANVSFSQRSLNQKDFKSNSSVDYREQIQSNYNELNAQSLFEMDKSYQRTDLSGIKQYVGDNEMIFEVHTLMNVKADRFLVVFNLTQIGETAAGTDELINSRIEGFTNAVKQLGITDKDIYIDMIYLIPTFEFEVEKKLFSKTFNEVPTGFEMQKNIHISFADIDKVDDLVTLAAKNEIYDLVKLDFFVDNTGAVNDSIRNKSVEYLNKKLASFKKLNLTLKDKYHVIREASYAIYPETQYSDYDAFVSQSIDAVRMKSGVTKIRKPKTVAYDQIPYNEFSIIINPVIQEPVVQYVYILQVKYTLDKPEEKNKNNYMLITPNGDIKKLDIQE